MRRTLPAAALAVAALLAPAPASAVDVVVLPGCWGVGGAAVCDVTVSVTHAGDVGMTTMPVPVCAGSCVIVEVPVPTASIDPGGEVCVSYRWMPTGQQIRSCWPGL